MSGTVEIVEPRADRRATAVTPARLTGALAGARVGFLDNNKNNAAVLLGRVRDRLVADYGVEPVWHQKPVSSVPLTAPTLRDLAECRVVLTGSAD